jgi:predicted nuclease of predicted toxin-antitoxin system
MNSPVTIVADENIPSEVIRGLRDKGFKVYWIAAEKPGIPDREVWQIAASKSAILLTRDKNFLPQLKKNEILHGPRVVVFAADGVEHDELRAEEVFTNLMTWYFEACGAKDWHYVTIVLKGKHRTRRQCWGDERLRRNNA